ncbi:MAG: S8/S53 family peptidase [Bdellovibrionales bacterium]|nr:S8/S53 family peptidase [Bdellovibrionales bacterium]
MNIREMLNQIINMNNTNKALLATAAAALAAGIAYRSVDSNPLETAEEYSDPVSNTGDYENAPVENNVEVSCESQALPSFINVSLSWGESNSYTEALGSLSPPSVIVTSAGNSHPEEIPQSKLNASKNFDAIIVGNLNTDGTRMPSSNQNEEVHIMAPASYYIATKDNEGSNRFIGGTSGAAALVTGSLGSFAWLSGYHPTSEEAKILLEKTSILTQYSHDDPRKNGVGMVNAYMLGMVGKKLKELCGTNITCFQEKIHEESTYEFTEDTGLSSAVAAAFPECGQSVCSGEVSSCVDKEAVFKRLRKAAFLNPSNKDLWRDVACVYNNGGFEENVKGVLGIYKSLFGPAVNDVAAYTMCSENADCALVPACAGASGSAPFSAVATSVADIHNIEQCGEVTLCNGKCSCGEQEDASTNDGVLQYSTACVNSQCVINTVAQTDRVPSQDDPISGNSINIDDEADPGLGTR